MVAVVDALWPLAHPVLSALATWWAAPVAVALILAAVAAGVGLGAAGDRLIGVRSVLAPLITALVGRRLRHQQPSNHKTNTPGGTS